MRDCYTRDRCIAWAFILFVFFDNKQHQLPHIHVKYGSYELIIAIEKGECLEGYLPNKQRKRAEAHIENNRVKLMAMWEQAVAGINPGKL